MHRVIQCLCILVRTGYSMFLITREKIESLKERLRDPGECRHCLEDLKKILEIKEALLWRADVGMCCAGPALPVRLFGQVELLKATVEALEEGDGAKAVSLFEDFASELGDF